MKTKVEQNGDHFIWLEGARSSMCECIITLYEEHTFLTGLQYIRLNNNNNINNNITYKMRHK